jgi:hypothetical protein
MMASPFSAKAVIQAQIELEAYTDGLKRLEKLEVELF